jgi:hypothetical protein
MFVEPDTEVVQRHPGRQSRPQPAHAVGAFSAKAEGSVELLVDGLHDLADARRPAPQLLGPIPLAPVAFERADDPRPVSIEPSSVVVLALEALVDHVRPRGYRSHAPEPRVGPSSQGEESFGQRLVLGGSGGEAEAGVTPEGSTATSRQKPSYHPTLLDHPMSA